MKVQVYMKEVKMLKGVRRITDLEGECHTDTEIWSLSVSSPLVFSALFTSGLSSWL